MATVVDKNTYVMLKGIKTGGYGSIKMWIEVLQTDVNKYNMIREISIIDPPRKNINLLGINRCVTAVEAIRILEDLIKK